MKGLQSVSTKTRKGLKSTVPTAKPNLRLSQSNLTNGTLRLVRLLCRSRPKQKTSTHYSH